MTPNDDLPESEEAARLGDDAVVVRGGVSAVGTLRDNAMEHHDNVDNISGDFAISAVCLPDKAAEELAEIGESRTPRSERRPWGGYARQATTWSQTSHPRDTLSSRSRDFRPMRIT